jgi:hypothetical protein
MIKPKQVKYRVTTAFGQIAEGSIINALLITDEGYFGLLYHPKVRGECPSFEIASVDSSGIWESTDKLNYVNVETNDSKFQKEFLGKQFKFKRIFYKEGK